MYVVQSLQVVNTERSSHVQHNTVRKKIKMFLQARQKTKRKMHNMDSNKSSRQHDDETLDFLLSYIN